MYCKGLFFWLDAIYIDAMKKVIILVMCVITMTMLSCRVHKQQAPNAPGVETTIKTDRVEKVETNSESVIDNVVNNNHIPPYVMVMLVLFAGWAIPSPCEMLGIFGKFIRDVRGK